MLDKSSNTPWYKGPPSSKLLTRSSPQKDPLRSPSDFPSKTSTRSVELEQSPSEELKLESSSPAWTSLSPPLMSIQSKCTTPSSLRLFPEITSDSRQGSLSQGHQERIRLRWLQERSPQRSRVFYRSGHHHEPPRTDWKRIHPRPRLPHSSHRLQIPGNPEELERPLRKSPILSRRETPPWSTWRPKSPCALKPSLNTLPSEDSPSETWNKPLP